MIGETYSIGADTYRQFAPTRKGTTISAPPWASHRQDHLLGPQSLVVVVQIGPSSMDDRTALIKAYNDGIPAVVQERASAGQHVIMVDMFTPFRQQPELQDRVALRRGASQRRRSRHLGTDLVPGASFGLATSALACGSAA